uniref:Uncharacterized protein n=1 Tax=Rhizophora mucronata TaxID=61149 RepID=A0A2P2PR67_RHIMU
MPNNLSHEISMLETLDMVFVCWMLCNFFILPNHI